MDTKSVKDLRDRFGYAFNAEGKLRKINAATGELTDEAFQFEKTSSNDVNQENYDELAKIISEYIYDLMEYKGLTRHYIPTYVPKEKASFVFCTMKEIKPCEKLLIIIHGSGSVTAGQWSRALIINNSLDEGTSLPYIRRGKQEGYEVIVTNTNLNEINGIPIEGSADPKQHAETVVREIVQQMEPKHIVIVAHSYGGIVTTYLARKFEEEFNKKVKAVVFTDSVHIRKNVSPRLAEVGVNFITSNAPINSVVSKRENEMEERSAGTIKHELTSHMCIDYAFEFIKEKEKSFT